MSTLLFSKRTVTAVTVFACLFVAKNAWHLPSATVAQVSALHSEHDALFDVYRRILHQDVANQAEVLDVVIALAGTAINNLNTTVQAIVPTPPTAFPLADIQTVVANAVMVMENVRAA